ncbi:ATP synthase subunit I [Pelorhabdus rhamnosifermentans]|uniref:ATP synthase subunit I n=1 Tax=Pelorhabdus rhamnosifermentans TaxID=2772457 RepID=UPI001FE2D06C|nr:ATP synthase subunit I [Pelorhabdus rhamnosifermentans]
MVFWQQKKVQAYCMGLAVWSAVLIAGMWLAGQEDELPGLILGMVTSLFYFFLLVLRAQRSVVLPVPKAVSSMRIGWLLRLFFILLMLVLSLKIPVFHFAAAVLGLFSFHIFMMLTACLFILKQRLLHKI